MVIDVGAQNQCLWSHILNFQLKCRWVLLCEQCWISCSSPYRKGKRWRKPRAIIARFVNREQINHLLYRRKELANSPNHRHVILVPDYAYETAKEQKNCQLLCETPKGWALLRYIKNGRLFVQGNSYSADNIPECFQNVEAVTVDE